MDPHIEEWKKIRERYMKSDIQDEKEFNCIKFRIECIENLIESAEIKEKDIAHFR